eukprot:5255998-Karenia_brevis.AAC.1
MTLSTIAKAVRGPRLKSKRCTLSSEKGLRRTAKSAQSIKPYPNVINRACMCLDHGSSKEQNM